ncbi:MAG: DUF309 domain-containing protein [Deltaproteobacteria bacterium]|nr:DUF309 domain-containing protein [Deltaproteobacteria bacterium]
MASSKVRRQEALAKFRDGRYFEAHQAFEELWRRSSGKERAFFQGWVLLSAALFHRDRGNAKGARTCLQRASERWGALPGEVEGCKLREVLRAVEAVLGSEWACPLLPGFGAPAEPVGGGPEEEGYAE